MSEWTVSGYTEVRELGAGAQGRVVLARHDASGAPAAIKYLIGADEADRERLRHEARMLGRADSPHIARLYSLVEGPDGAAIVMEAIDGVSLKEILAREGALGPEASLAVLKGSLLGLAAAHSLGVVHRDYKPANVVVPADGLSRLVDFGIAAPAGQEAGGAGTPYYMAPEQWDRHTATPATDVYAATCVFVECATGSRPYTGDRAALMLAHRTGEIPLDAVPEPLRPLVARGMAKSPADRPAAASAFVEELEAVAVAAYGPGWEHTGVRALAASAAALASLFPIAAAFLPGAAQGTSGAAGQAVAHGAGEAAAQGGGQAAAETIAHGAGEAAAQGAGQAGAQGAGQAAAHGAGKAAAGGAGKAVAAKAGTGGLKAMLGIGAAACGTAVVIGGGAVVAMQQGDDSGRTGAGATASPSRTVTVAAVRGCTRMAPNSNDPDGMSPLTESPPAPTVELPAVVDMPDGAAVYYVGGGHVIGPADGECDGQIGASSGLHRIGDPLAGGSVFESFNWADESVGAMHCRYFPDTERAAARRAAVPQCDADVQHRQELTGLGARAAVTSGVAMGTDAPPSPYVAVSLAVLPGAEEPFMVIDCVMPWERRNICNAALTYWLVRQTADAKPPTEALQKASTQIANFVETIRR
ncbi:serine/threonine-protein kinase [Spirillospora sp. NPDC052242]